MVESHPHPKIPNGQHKDLHDSMVSLAMDYEAFGEGVVVVVGDHVELEHQETVSS